MSSTLIYAAQSLRDRPPRSHLSKEDRAYICGLADGGFNKTQINALTNVAYSTISDTLSKRPLRNNNESFPRAGRPKKYPIQDVRRIIRAIVAEPKIKYKRLLHETGLKLSRTTITAILKPYGFAKRPCKRRPKLTPVIATKRLAFALTHQDWTTEMWRKVI
jgi:hypothetical protein